MPGRVTRRLLALCVPGLALAAEARGQVPASARLADFAVNAAIGGVIAGARSLLLGGSIARPLALGALGGGVQGLGRQIAASPFTGSGLLGREVSALGISLTYSAGVDSLVVFAPLGPVMLELRPGTAQALRARVSLFDVLTLGLSLADRESSFDLEASLSAGAPTFRRPRSRMPLGAQEGGFAQVGTIFLAREEPADSRRLTLRHESVHVLQWDALSQLVALPVERALVSRLPGGAWLERHADVGALAPLTVYFVSRQLPYEQHPWEREAYRLTTGRPTANR
jgi:hypothetical protein